MSPKTKRLKSMRIRQRIRKEIRSILNEPEPKPRLDVVLASALSLVDFSTITRNVKPQ